MVRTAESRERAGESGWGDVVAGKHVVRTVERQAEVSYKYLAEQIAEVSRHGQVASFEPLLRAPVLVR